MPEMTTAEAIVRSLKAQGIERLFCLPGVQNDDFFDALHRVGQSIRPITVRHEQATAYMALGAALATGKPQAFSVVPGPGILNALTPLATAQSLSAPLLALVGQVPDRHIGKGHGYLHEIPNQLGLVANLTRYAARTSSAADAAEKVRAAFADMLANDQRPALLECAIDRWGAKGEAQIDETPVARQIPAIDEDAIGRAARILGAAERPIIVVGGGAQDAGAEVQAIAEMLQAPVVSHRTGHGVLSSRHPLSQRLVAGHIWWKEADAVLGIGTRLQIGLQSWGTDAGLPVVHLDADPNCIGRIAAPTVGIVADAAEGLRALIARLGPHNRKRTDRSAEMAALKTEARRRIDVLSPQITFCEAIRAELPEDGIFVEDLTQIGYVSRLAFEAYAPRTFLSTGYQGTLGWSLAAGIGAKIARPEKKVVAISGDGGFLFNVQELATAVQQKVVLVTVLFNDGTYGNVQRTQREVYGGRIIATDLTNPDFIKLAESFGIWARRVKNAAELRPALREALAAEVPALIEVPVGRFPDPWPHLLLPRVRG